MHLLGSLIPLVLLDLPLDLDRAQLLELLLEDIPAVFLLLFEFLLIVLPLGVFQAICLLALPLPLDVGIFDSFFLLQLQLRLYLGLEEHLTCVVEPNLPVIVLVEISMHLEHLDLVDTLQVETHFQHHSQAVVFWAQVFQLGLDHLIELEVGKLAISGLALSNEFFPVFFTNLTEVVIQA